MTANSSQIAQTHTKASLSSRRAIFHWLPIILILWLALFLRVWQLDVLPPGLHYDEAFKGVKARAVLSGAERPIFFTENFGEEPLQIYSTALMLTLVGESPWAIRLSSVFFGVIFVAALYACARAFFPRRNLLAPVAAFIAATLYWAINFSRIGIESNSLPMLLTLSAATLARAYRTSNWKWVIGSGGLLGATIYTYLASRVWYFAVLLWFIYLVIFHRATFRANFSKWLAIGILAALIIAPLALFFIANPIALTGRSDQVFTPETILPNLARTAGMFLVTGDTDPRDNLPGRPALDGILFIFFAIGFIISLVRVRKPFYAFLLIWLVVMSLPSALTEFAPNMRRAIGTMPAAILLCALGFDWLAQKFVTFKFGEQAAASSRRIVQIGFPAILFLALLLSAFWSARAYFVEWANDPGLYYSFDAGILQVATALAARPADEALYLTPKYDDHPTVQWALNGRAISSFDGRRALVLPDSSHRATYGIITHEDTQTLTALEQYSTRSLVLKSFSDLAGQPYANILKLDTNSQSHPVTNVTNVGDFAILGQELCPKIEEQSAPSDVQLCWQVLKPASENYTVFVHLVGPTNPTTGSPVWAQEDEQPGGGTYPTLQWHAGQIIVEQYNLKLPDEMPPGSYMYETGMYSLENSKRVPLTQNGTRLPNDALTFGSFTLK